MGETRRGRELRVERKPNTSFWRVVVEGGGNEPITELFTSHARAVRAAQLYTEANALPDYLRELRHGTKQS